MFVNHLIPTLLLECEYRKVKRKSKERATPFFVRLAETYHYRRNRSTSRRVMGSLKKFRTHFFITNYLLFNLFFETLRVLNYISTLHL